MELVSEVETFHIGGQVVLWLVDSQQFTGQLHSNVHVFFLSNLNVQ